MEAAIPFVIGILIGSIFRGLIMHVMTTGELRIDTSDPQAAPYIFLQLSEGTSALHRKKYVTLRVNWENFNPQK